MQKIYLDYNATTPVASQVYDSILPFLSTHFGNPSSGHTLGRACAEAIQESREQVAGLLGAKPDEIIFTGCGTESNNIAIKGAMFAANQKNQGHLIVSSIEHPSVIEPAKHMQRLGFDVSFAPADSDGVVQPDAIENLIRPDTHLVSVMHANNETGTIQPISQIAKLCKAHQVLLHCDAAQSIGKIRVKVDELDADLLTMAGHKFHAPKGIGALYIRNGITVEPVIHGAGHEQGIRPGTENTPYIVGLGKAAAMVDSTLDEARERMEAFRDYFLGRLREVIGSSLTVNSEAVERLPNTLSLNFPNVTATELLTRVPEICVSTGAACHSGATTISSTLKSIGHTSETAKGTVRISIGRDTKQTELDRAASLLLDAWEKMQ